MVRGNTVSKSERAMLNISFFGVIFLVAMLQPMSVSHLGGFDIAAAAIAAALMVGHGIYYLFLVWKEKW